MLDTSGWHCRRDLEIVPNKEQRQTLGSEEGTGIDGNNVGVSNTNCHDPTGHSLVLTGGYCKFSPLCKRCLTFCNAHTTLGASILMPILQMRRRRQQLRDGGFFSSIGKPVSSGMRFHSE